MQNEIDTDHIAERATELWTALRRLEGLVPVAEVSAARAIVERAAMAYGDIMSACAAEDAAGEAAE